MERRTDEILSAEVFLESLGPKVDTSAIDAELGCVEKELKAYVADVSTREYGVAMLSGFVSGAIDAFLVGKISLSSEDITAFPRGLWDKLQKMDVASVIKGAPPENTLKRAVAKGVTAEIPWLEKLALQMSPLGLMASVVLHLGLGGMIQFTKDNGLHVLPKDLSRVDGSFLLVAGIIAGIASWLVSASEKGDGQGAFTSELSMFTRLRDLFQSTPAIREIVEALKKWQRQLPNALKANNKDNKTNISGVFMSLLSGIALQPSFRKTKLPAAVKALQEAEAAEINSLPLVNVLGEQALPVMFNELFVRTAFFIMRLVREISLHGDLMQIEWENVIPVKKKAVDRMMTVASMTLTVADTADAAIRAAVESKMNWVVFAGRFVSRFNYVAAGRAAVAVYKEISDEQAEEFLLREKRMLTESKYDRVREQLLAYRQQVEEKLAEYLAEDISAFLKGFAIMEKGIASGSSDLVIRGNVVIQRVLGREPQFTDQNSFDELMQSDIPLQL